MRSQMFRILKKAYIDKLKQNPQSFKIKGHEYRAIRDFVIEMDMATERELRDMESDLDMAFRISEDKEKSNQ